MVDFGKVRNSRGTMAAGAAVLLALGAAGGAGAVHATRPAIEMAPTVRTPIARLAATDGVVTVKGRVAEVYGDRFVMQDGSGRAMIAAGREGREPPKVGQSMTVQGRFDDGQLRASYLVDQNGSIAAVGPAGPRPGGPDGPAHDGPPPPPGCGPAPTRPGAVPPPPPLPMYGAERPQAGAVPPPPGGPQPPAAGRVSPSAVPTASGA